MHAVVHVLVGSKGNEILLNTETKQNNNKNNEK